MALCPRLRRLAIRAGAFLAAGALALFAGEGVFRAADPRGVSYQVEATEYLLSLRPGAHPLVYRQGTPRTRVGRYRFNNFGFRGADFSIEKPAGTRRILAIGDSVTFCMGVDEGETWPALLEARLRERSRGPRYEVYNLSVGGFNSVGELGLLLSPGLGFDPDAVVLLVVGNDHEIQPGNADLYRLFPSLANGTDESLPRPSTWPRDTIAYPIWRAANGVVPYVANFAYIHGIGARTVKRDADPARGSGGPSTGAIDMGHALDLVAATCAARGIDLHLVWYGRPDESEPYAVLARSAAKAGRPVATLALEPGEFRNSDSDAHLNAAGCRLLAEELDASLGEALLGPPPR